MFCRLKRILNPIRAVTHKDVLPATVDPAQAKTVREAQIDLVQKLMAAERSGADLRHELASKALRIVAGT